MMLHPVNSDILKHEDSGWPLWFTGDENDLYIILTRNKIVHFETTIEHKYHIEGGAHKPLKFGNVSPCPKKATFIKRSRLIDYEKKIPDEIMDLAIQIVDSSRGLEKAIKDGIIQFLMDKGKQKNSTLISNNPYDSYVEVEEKPRTFTSMLLGHWKLATMLILGIVAGAYMFSTLTSLKKEELIKGCNADKAEKCYILAVREKVAGHDIKAKALFDKANKIKDNNKLKQAIERCNHNSFGFCLIVADNAKTNGEFEKAKELLEKACNGGSGEGCCILANYYKGENDLINSRKLNSQGCSHGVMKGCYRIGKIEKACKGDFVQACYEMAEIAVRKNKLDQAHQLFSKACSRNFKNSCYRKKFVIEFKESRERCFAGSALECSKYAEIESRRGNKLIAKRYHQKACKANIFESCFALKLYRKACKGGHSPSCVKLKRH